MSVVNKEYVCVYITPPTMVEVRAIAKETGVPISRIAEQGLLRQVEIWRKRLQVNG